MYVLLRCTCGCDVLVVVVMYVTLLPGKPLKIDALRLAIKNHDLKVETAHAEAAAAAAAALLAQNASALSFNRVARRGIFMFCLGLSLY